MMFTSVTKPQGEGAGQGRWPGTGWGGAWRAHPWREESSALSIEAKTGGQHFKEATANWLRVKHHS